MLHSFVSVMKNKCFQYNIPFILADRFYKSSQICSKCGAINPISGNYHVYRCKECGNEMDRDLNAAKNLANYYYNNSFEITA